MRRTDESQGMKGYCIFPCREGSLAVSVDAVEAVTEASRIVRLPLCPGAVLALGIYRGSILPIVRPFESSRGWDTAPTGRLPAVLVLRTRRGYLGLLIDRGSLAVVEACQISGMGGPAAVHEQVSHLPEGLVAAGAIERDGTSHAVLDVDRTWTAMRCMIASGIEGSRREGE